MKTFLTLHQGLPGRCFSVPSSGRGLHSVTVFAQSLTEQFMKVLICLHLMLHYVLPNWESFLILQTLVGKPFEAMVTCPLHLLAWEMAFLVTITSARKVGKVRALQHPPPYLTIHAESASLSPDIIFLSKVASEFHLWVAIHLPTFFLYHRNS